MSSTSNLAVVRHPPIRNQIATILRNAIVSREFSPGQVLVERDLCERTGASRPSVREALRQLEAEGLVESRNGRGTIVRVLTTTEVSNLYEVRADLEGLAAGLFSERATEKNRDELHSALTDLREATRTDDAQRSSRILEAQAEFYSVLFAGTMNPILDQLIQGLQVRLAQLRAATLTMQGRAESSFAEFQAIVEAIDAGDRAGAHEAALHHVEQAAEVMAQMMENEERANE